MTALASPPDQALHEAFAAWKKTVLAELNGVPFEKKLVTRTFEDLALQPLYTRADLAGLKDLDKGANQPPFLRGTRVTTGRGWSIAQAIPLSEPSEYNAALRENLQHGQDAVILRSPAQDGSRGVTLVGLQDFSTALESIDISAVSVHLAGGANPSALVALYFAFVQDRGVPLSELTGSVTADPLGEAAASGEFPHDFGACCDELADWTRWTAANTPRLETIGVNAALWGNAGATATQELAIALASPTTYLQVLLQRGVPLELAAHRIRFHFSAGSQFFTEIAKFRAFRPLWTRVLMALGGSAQLGAAGSISAATATWDKTLLDPHVNMLRTTTEALSAVLGGCDALHITSYDEVSGKTSAFSRRIALNLHTLLAEEFGFAQPCDPAGGSWYVEKLTDDVARGAWKLFQDFESRGGFASCLRTGYVQQLVEKARLAKASAVATRRVSLVGTNLFPNLKETPLSAAVASLSSPYPRVSTTATLPPTRAKFDHAFADAIKAVLEGATLASLQNRLGTAAPDEVAITPVEPWRAAEGFETLRRRAAAYAAQKGTRPRVFLARMGAPAQHKARADFSAAFFAAAGFEASGTGKFDAVEAAADAAIKSSAPIVVLCSSDETYPLLAPAFAQKIKTSSPSTVVVLAGLPADPATATAFRAAGFDEFIHARANVQEMLATFLSKIGATV